MADLSDLQTALARIQAAMFVIDQIYYGDLSYLNEKAPAVNCWESYVSMPGHDLRDYVRGMAQREVAEALRDADVAMREASARREVA